MDTPIPVPIFVGYTTRIRPDVKLWDWMNEPPVPGSIKKEESKEKWIREDRPKKMQEIEVKAKFFKFFGKPSSITALDPSLPVDEQMKTWDDGNHFLSWLFRNHPNAFPTYPQNQGAGSRGVAIFAFKAKELVRMLGINGFTDSMHTSPVGLWYNNQDCFDPYDMLVESDNRSLLPHRNLLRMLGIPKVSSSYEPHQHAFTDLLMVLTLVYKFQLCPLSDGNRKLIAEIAKQLAAKAEEPAVEDDSEEDDSEYEDEDEEKAEVEEKETKRKTKTVKKKKKAKTKV